eukprot:CAMPEP_0119503646 /NCGR_PEP_ID=MMETSP1344-20130328/24755_1 /TAXON_ID=236787 /ORGANISM="Florenciella parvula, Strain CCMP2471" /LENGTH=64 /DNA_ID=CAMNT_0007539957 /DNA_START=231 /DNA_END=426 /DNA_ORIENTATION=-
MHAAVATEFAVVRQGGPSYATPEERGSASQIVAPSPMFHHDPLTTVPGNPAPDPSSELCELGAV